MRILIAFDGSEAAEAALLRRAAAWGADLLVVGLARPSAQNPNAGGAARRVIADAPYLDVAGGGRLVVRARR